MVWFLFCFKSTSQACCLLTLYIRTHLVNYHHLPFVRHELLQYKYCFVSFVQGRINVVQPAPTLLLLGLDKALPGYPVFGSTIIMSRDILLWPHIRSQLMITTPVSYFPQHIFSFLLGPVTYGCPAGFDVWFSLFLFLASVQFQP